MAWLFGKALLFNYVHDITRSAEALNTSSGYGGRFAPSGFPRRWCAKRVITIFS